MSSRTSVFLILGFSILAVISAVFVYSNDKPVQQKKNSKAQDYLVSSEARIAKDVENQTKATDSIEIDIEAPLPRPDAKECMALLKSAFRDKNAKQVEVYAQWLQSHGEFALPIISDEIEAMVVPVPANRHIETIPKGTLTKWVTTLSSIAASIDARYCVKRGTEIASQYWSHVEYSRRMRALQTFIVSRQNDSGPAFSNPRVSSDRCAATLLVSGITSENHFDIPELKHAIQSLLSREHNEQFSCEFFWLIPLFRKFDSIEVLDSWRPFGELIIDDANTPDEVAKYLSRLYVSSRFNGYKTLYDLIDSFSELSHQESKKNAAQYVANQRFVSGKEILILGQALRKSYGEMNGLNNFNWSLQTLRDSAQESIPGVFMTSVTSLLSIARSEAGAESIPKDGSLEAIMAAAAVHAAAEVSKSNGESIADVLETYSLSENDRSELHSALGIAIFHAIDNPPSMRQYSSSRYFAIMFAIAGRETENYEAVQRVMEKQRNAISLSQLGHLLNIALRHEAQPYSKDAALAFANLFQNVAHADPGAYFDRRGKPNAGSIISLPFFLQQTAELRSRFARTQDMEKGILQIKEGMVAEFYRNSELIVQVFGEKALEEYARQITAALEALRK